MSDSRLEKFIYAICSMDVSDLPVPLSRIEKLWNCLITGETPDFEPLSRNEKYLMAMLDRYDISNLPAPMSRGEKLLYKIAVGETDLSDVPGYLSRYEELLKYLIENGGISEGDFEYVLYTLNQSLSTLYSTAEKPVKSAILKGQTLVNLATITERFALTDGRNNLVVKLNYPLSANAKYLINVFNLPNDMKYVLTNRKSNSNWIMPSYVNGKTVFTSQCNSDAIITLHVNDGSTYRPLTQEEINKIQVILIEYQEGMENWDIPYFEGMQSVKMPVLSTTGKNLFDKEAFYNDWKSKVESYVYKEIVDNEEVLKVNNHYHLFDDNKGFRINVKKGVPLTLRMEYKKAGTKTTNGVFAIRYGDNIYKSFPVCNSDEWETATATFVPTRDYITICSGYNDDEYFYVKNMQIEEGSIATKYEPFKSNILRTSEEVTLRGIGDAQDKLDCLTGEVTESIREIVLDGTQYMDADGRGIYIQFDDMKKVEDYRTIITCDKLPVFYRQWDLPNVENGIAGYLDEENKYPGQNWLYIKVNNSIDVGEVRQILTQNPISVQYQLAQESIKTVDLTVVDQDNQPTELGTFENVTHVSLEAENLIPEVEMEVATRISTELTSASPLMDDISTKQEQLSTTIDEQSENVDATMIATTEIFEETL